MDMASVVAVLPFVVLEFVVVAVDLKKFVKLKIHKKKFREITKINTTKILFGSSKSCQL